MSDAATIASTASDAPVALAEPILRSSLDAPEIPAALDGLDMPSIRRVLGYAEARFGQESTR